MSMVLLHEHNIDPEVLDLMSSREVCEIGWQIDSVKDTSDCMLKQLNESFMLMPGCSAPRPATDQFVRSFK
jgi:hypothetical protein